MAKTARTTISCGFGSLMDIDKLIQNTQSFWAPKVFWFSDGY